MTGYAILVTGGAGYIGSHVCKALAKAGYIPITYDSLITGFQEAVQWGPFEKGDIRDDKALQRVFKKYQIVGVVHLAALIEVHESVIDPMRYYDVNVSGMISLLKVMDEFFCKRIVFSSSAAVYGIPNQSPVTEGVAKRPINPYGSTKLFGEQILERLFFERNIASCALRYFNASGADLELETGERKADPSHLIPRVLRAALRKEVVSVYGDDYATRDGSCIRDYIHVADLAAAHVKALELLEKKQGYYAYNLGSKRGLSVFEILEAAKRVTKLPISYGVKGRREGDPPILVADSSCAEQELEWKAAYSTAEEILSSAFAWQKKMLDDGQKKWSV